MIQTVIFTLYNGAKVRKFYEENDPKVFFDWVIQEGISWDSEHENEKPNQISSFTTEFTFP